MTRTKTRALANWPNNAVSVLDFGADPTGLTDSTAAIQAAIDSLPDGGVIYFPTGTYKLPDRSSNYFVLTNRENLSFEGYGATLDVDCNNQVNLFFMDGCRNIAFKGFTINGNFSKSGSTVTQESIICFGAAATLQTSTNIHLSDIRASTCKAFFISSLGSSTDERVRNINITNCALFTGYYGINCQNQGDNLTVSNFHTSNALRSYFVYGVDNHQVQYLSTGGDALTDCLIKAYNRDTTNITVQATIENNTSPNAKLTIESQINLGETPNKCEDIHVTLNDLEGCTGKSARFAFFTGSTETLVPPSKIMDRITIRGRSRQDIDVAVDMSNNFANQCQLNVEDYSPANAGIYSKGFFRQRNTADADDANGFVGNLCSFTGSSSSPNYPSAAGNYVGFNAGSGYGVMQIAFNISTGDLYVRGSRSTSAPNFTFWKKYVPSS